MGLLNMVRIGCYIASTIHATTYGRSRDYNDTLSFRAGHIQSAVHTQLDLPVFLCGTLCGCNTMDSWSIADNSVLGLLLDLLYQVGYTPVSVMSRLTYCDRVLQGKKFNLPV